MAANVVAGNETPARSDFDLLMAARAGDEEAARLLLTAVGPGMLRAAWRVLGRYGDADAEDVVQEAFLAALTTPALPFSNVGAWMHSIVARKALDWVRRHRRRAEEEWTGDEIPGGRSPGGKVPERDAPLHVLAARQGLARISARERALLTMIDLDGLTMREAGRVLGCSEIAVRLRASRARRRLRNALLGIRTGKNKE